MNRLSNIHWTMPNYRQRMTTKEWKQVLLDSGDKILFHGRLVQLKVKVLGFGVVEVYKNI